MSTSSGVWMPLWEWRVRNFKSIAEAALKLEPLTLLVGPNSSGKSSIIQSILVMVQAAQAETQGSTLPLNGSLVSLGGYKDVRSQFASESEVRMGGNFAFNDEDLPRLEGLESVDYRPLPQFRRPLSSPFRGAVDLDISFDRGSLDEPGSAELSSVHLDVSAEDEGLTSLVLDAARRGEGEQQEDRERIRVGKLTWPVRDEFALGFSGTLRQIPDRDVSIQGLSLAGGVPQSVVTEWGLGALAAHSWVENRARRPFWRGSSGPGLRDPQATFHPRRKKVDIQTWAERAVEDIRNWYGVQREKPVRFGEFLAREAPKIDMRDRMLLRAVAADLVEEIIKRIDIEDPALAPPEAYMTSGLEESASAVHGFLSERVVYLGPLREDPRVTYRSTPVGAFGYIGTKGEYMASVVNAGRSQDVACPTDDGRLEVKSLARALDYWVSRLDLAESVNTSDLGRLGIEVSVRRGGLAKLDLTSVGVGVSQLLPVVVTCLLAPPGSLVLLEQPELHLHPAVQQKLGDFFIACSKGGRQLIVETHSEYLVNRLRLRVAESVSTKLLDQVAVYFAEQVDGVSTFRRVELNRLGGIDDWPHGFFDQAANESRRILEAGIAKKLDPARATEGRAE